MIIKTRTELYLNSQPLLTATMSHRNEFAWNIILIPNCLRNEKITIITRHA